MASIWSRILIAIGVVAFAASPLFYILHTHAEAEARRDPLIWEDPVIEGMPFLLDGRWDVEFRVPFRNTSTDVVQMRGLSATCGCTDLKPLPTSLPAGYQGELQGRIRLTPKDHLLRTLVRTSYLRRTSQFEKAVPIEFRCRRPIETDSPNVNLVGYPNAAARVRFRQFRRERESEFGKVVYSSRGDPISVQEVGEWRSLPNEDG